MLHPSSACPYAQPTLNTEQNWSKLEKSQSVAQTVCQADLSYATQSQSQSQWVCARVCVACCVGVAIKRAPSCSSCSGTVRRLVSGNQSNRSQCYYRHTTVSTNVCVCVCAYDRVCVSYHQLCLGPHFRHVFYNVANLSFDVARQHVAATFSFRLNWMHLESRSAAEASSLYDHHHHPRTIGCHWHWTAMLPFMAHRRRFCANARFL